MEWGLATVPDDIVLVLLNFLWRQPSCAAVLSIRATSRRLKLLTDQYLQSTTVCFDESADLNVLRRLAPMLSEFHCAKIDESTLQHLLAFPNLRGVVARSCTNMSADMLTALSSQALTTLSLGFAAKVSNLGFVEACPQLETMILSGAYMITDISPLSTLRRLSVVSLTGSDWLVDVSPLNGLPRLREVSLAYTRVTDLSPLVGSRLTKLSLRYSRNLGNVEPLALVTSLTSLDLTYCDSLTRLDPLKALTALQHLIVAYCSGISDLSPLSNLHSLSTLNLSSCGRVLSVGPLASLTSLVDLDISDCPAITDVTALTGLVKLTKLSISGCEWISDINCLSDLPLHTLNISGCSRIADISQLFPDHPTLALLNLSYCPLLDEIDPTPLIPQDPSFSSGPRPPGILRRIGSLRRARAYNRSHPDLSPPRPARDTLSSTDGDGGGGVGDSARSILARVSPCWPSPRRRSRIAALIDVDELESEPPPSPVSLTPQRASSARCILFREASLGEIRHIDIQQLIDGELSV